MTKNYPHDLQKTLLNFAMDFPLFPYAFSFFSPGHLYALGHGTQFEHGPGAKKGE
jgi:hypothetical protein